MNLLEIDHVSKAFGGLQALREVAFTVEAGAIVGVMGANGAGKTTLFSLIAGHVRPDSGAIRFAGRRSDGLRSDVVCRLGIARTFQIVRPLRGLSVLDNVATAALFGAAERLGPRAAEDKAHLLLEELGLGGQAQSLAGALTLSQQKRLEVARALASTPRLLLLDEVMAGLTPTEVAEMLATLRRIHGQYGLTLLVIEHVLRALMDLSDRIVVLHHGELIATGAPAAIAQHSAVHAAYFGTAV
ncbi:MAG: ABC transporter ATP-binding protein [Gammaproteobacteria bacterium]